MEEMRQSVFLINQLLNFIPIGPIKSHDKFSPPSRWSMKEDMEALIHHFKYYSENLLVKKQNLYSAIEAPKGEMGVYAFADGSSRLMRCKIRAPGFFHLQGLSWLSLRHLLADLVTLIGTLDLVLGEIDR